MKRNLFILILTLQSAWVLYMVAVQESALREGTPILLETERVDPRDLLRGDYLILNYKISSVPGSLFSPPVETHLSAGTKVFVALKPDGEFHVVTRASTNAFRPAAGELLVMGRSTWPMWNRTNSIHVEYGLEKYFVREGTGNPTGKLTVQVVVPQSGRASIKEVFLDGKPYAEAMKEQSR